MMKRWLACLGICLIVLMMPLWTLCLNAQQSTDQNQNAALTLTAKSAILIDANTGKVLFSKNPDEKLPIASLTKIMSMILIFEKLEAQEITLDQQITISENAAGMGGTQLFLEAGEVRTVEELLYGTAVESANDAVTALAEYIGGTLEGFVQMMNEKASALGLQNTHFVDACGLTDENHYSTASDLAVLSRILLQHKEARKYITTWMIDINVGKNNDITRTLANSNILLKTYEGCDGIKTGYTEKALSCLAFSATRSNMSLIGIVLGCKTGKDRNSEAASILDYGFTNYQSKCVVKKGEELTQITVKNAQNTQVPLVAKEDVYVLVAKGSQNDDSTSYDKTITMLEKNPRAPIAKDTVLAQAVLVGENENLTIDLVTKEDIAKASFVQYFLRNLRI